MILPEKTYSDNPFVDNVIYYAKWLAMNCVVKDEDEALANETEASLSAGDLYVACIEGYAIYEMFTSIPKEILEKYITVQSNLDLYATKPNTLKVHLNHYSIHQRTSLLNKLSETARETYMDHYLIMTEYLSGLSGSWLDDYKPLYNSCIDGTATYADLYDIMPYYTKKRIILQYLNNFDTDKINELARSLETFQQYIDARTDVQITTELENISKAMRDVFKSHYEIMVERGYVALANNEMQRFVSDEDTYKLCQRGKATYKNLYKLFPEDKLHECLAKCINEEDIDKYMLTFNLETLENYFLNYSSNPSSQQIALNSAMQEVYLSNYNSYLNESIYNKCAAKTIDYFGLVDYLPTETKKMIINKYIAEVTNLQVYQDSKEMLNAYLATLPENTRNEIKTNIVKDMMEWYPSHHEETNNYYRALIGLPPLDNSGNVCVDTLQKSYDSTTGTFVSFGDRFIKQLPTGIYPEIHWKQELYEFDSYDIGILESYGILDDYIEACGASPSDARYKYIRHLADNKLDLYQCRKAAKFQLIGIPTVDDDDAQKRFVDCFNVNRDYVIRAVYSDAHKFQSDYYDKFMIIFILINTIMDMLSGITEMIIDREVFDSRCIKWLFESYGVPYYSEIPIKYLRAMLKNLNLLLKYKSSTRNMIDICNLFGFSDVKVFGYYLFKDRNVDVNTGEYIMDEDNDIDYNPDVLWVKDINGSKKNPSGISFSRLTESSGYEASDWFKTITIENEDGTISTKQIIDNTKDIYLYEEETGDFISLYDSTYFTQIKANTNPAEIKFIKVPVDEQLTEYKNDPNYIITYDEIVYEDEGDTWHGGLDHDVLYNRFMDYNFNAAKTKYISIESVTDLTEQSFQVTYFYNMLFDNLYSEEALTMEIPYIQKNHKFKFMDIVCYLFAMMYYYNDISDNIMYSPTQILYIKGYNFDEALNEILSDPKAFTQEADMADRENIFDINTRIAEDGYDYQEAFADYNIRSFNLSADIDELDAWLQENAQMSLDDIVVDGTDITFRQFFSLNNSYYQKDIFKDNVYPLPYNQNIKSAYDLILYTRDFENDLDGYEHSYILVDNAWLEVIDLRNGVAFSVDDYAYIMDQYIYTYFTDGSNHSIFYLYTKDDYGNYVRSSDVVYYYNYNTGVMDKLFDKKISIIDEYNRYIFSADAYYEKNDVTGEYSEITDEKFFTEDPNNPDKRLLIFGNYWIQNDDSTWSLDPEQAYVLVTINGVQQYVRYVIAASHIDFNVSEDDCWIRHEDGHFVQYIDTDYYTKRKTNGENISVEYYPEDTYIKVDYDTEISDTTLDGEVRYFRKLNDVYQENKWNISSELYIYDPATKTYIPEDELLSPNNCYYMNSDGVYALVVKNFASYLMYSSTKGATKVLILRGDNDYDVLELRGYEYIITEDPVKRFVYNSDPEYVTALLNNATYAETQMMVVVFNRAITSSDANELYEIGKYNPEVTDNVWDENDWFYYPPGDVDEEYSAMSGENTWYYHKPGSVSAETEEKESDPVGSGFYMESSAYIGDVALEKGNKYYMSFYVETNFTGKIQIYNTADDSVSSINDRIYEVSRGEKFYVSHVFVANEIEHPEIRFIIYDFDNFPISVGDMVIVSNIKFVKAYSDNFIAQDITSYDTLMRLYNTNEAIYKYLCELMANESDYRKYQIYKKLYDSLMTSKYNKEAFKIGEDTYAKTYTEFLENRDAVLYARLSRFKTLDPDAMHSEIANEIIEVTYALDTYIDTYSYGFLYSYFPAVSANYIQQYITKLINWFKSWKVHLLGINTVYKLGDGFENTVRALETKDPKIRIDFLKGNAYIHDTVKVNPLDGTNVSGTKYTDLYDLCDPVMEANEHLAPRDRIRIISRSGSRIEYTDNNTMLHLIFDDDGIIVNTDDNILTISSSNAGFRYENGNDMIITTDEDDQSVYPAQVIDEINHLTGDYIEWRDLLDG
jgi:hypothetical protein